MHNKPVPVPGSFGAFHEQNPDLTRQEAVELFTEHMIQSKASKAAIGNLAIMHVADQLDIHKLQSRGVNHG